MTGSLILHIHYVDLLANQLNTTIGLYLLALIAQLVHGMIPHPHHARVAQPIALVAVMYSSSKSYACTVCASGNFLNTTNNFADLIAAAANTMTGLHTPARVASSS